MTPFRRRCRFRDALVALGALLTLWAVTVQAQPCCSGGTALTPARLTLHEDALVGLQLRPTLLHGSFAPDRSYAASPPATVDLDFEEDLLGAVRVVTRGQVAV